MIFFLIGLATGASLALIAWVWIPGVRSHFLGAALDPTRPDELTLPTDRQLAAKLRACSDAELVSISRRILDNSEAARSCVILGHDHAVRFALDHVCQRSVADEVAERDRVIDRLRVDLKQVRWALRRAHDALRGDVAAGDRP